MPLLTSPIDGSPMRQIHRFGIELDVCPTSGGVWLDKGELEKLISLMNDEAAAADPDRAPEFRRHDREEDDEDLDHHRRRGGRRRSRLLDIFDF